MYSLTLLLFIPWHIIYYFPTGEGEGEGSFFFIVNWTDDAITHKVKLKFTLRNITLESINEKIRERIDFPYYICWFDTDIKEEVEIQNDEDLKAAVDLVLSNSVNKINLFLHNTTTQAPVINNGNYIYMKHSYHFFTFYLCLFYHDI